jgi:hypothetical protein
MKYQAGIMQFLVDMLNNMATASYLVMNSENYFATKWLNLIFIFSNELRRVML